MQMLRLPIPTRGASALASMRLLACGRTWPPNTGYSSMALAQATSLGIQVVSRTPVCGAKFSGTDLGGSHDVAGNDLDPWVCLLEELD